MSCKIIPVVDIQNGTVVRAVAGNREDYRVLTNPMFNSTSLNRIIEILLHLSRSKALYVANLNGISGDASYNYILYEIFTKFKHTEIWLDNGFKDLEEFKLFKKNYLKWCDFNGDLSYFEKNLVPVFGTETISDDLAYEKIFSTLKGAVLSIDKKNNAILGLVKINSIFKLLPDRVILMNLDKVGTNSGPDVDWLRNMVNRNSSVQFFGAGGLRDKEDYKNISSSGAAGWLVSSSIFDLMAELNDK